MFHVHTWTQDGDGYDVNARYRLMDTAMDTYEHLAAMTNRGDEPRVTVIAGPDMDRSGDRLTRAEVMELARSEAGDSPDMRERLATAQADQLTAYLEPWDDHPAFPEPHPWYWNKASDRWAQNIGHMPSPELVTELATRYGQGEAKQWVKQVEGHLAERAADEVDGAARRAEEREEILRQARQLLAEREQQARLHRIYQRQFTASMMRGHSVEQAEREAEQAQQRDDVDQAERDTEQAVQQAKREARTLERTQGQA